MSSSNGLLVQQMKDGSKAAFEVLFHQHYAMLCRSGTRWVQDPDQVKEIVQDTFVSIWEKRNSLNISGSFRSYLFSSVRNACLNHIKHQKVRAVHQSHVLATGNGMQPAADEQLEASELQRAIGRAVDALPERCRAVFLLSREGGKRYAEIADEMNISVKTVEVQMGKALKRLRIQLKDFLTVLVLMWTGNL